MDIRSKPLISVVSPVYKAGAIVEELVRQLKLSLASITEDFEIILVNDRSPDDSWEKIIQESRKDIRIKGIQLSRNFGQHYAITAGLDHAEGEWVIVMDCDLQDRPDEIPNLYRKAKEGWDIVFARRTGRKDKLGKRISSGIFYRVYNYLSDLDFDGGIANFGIYHAKVIAEYRKMREGSRSFPSLIQYLGFNSCAIDVEHADRFDGKSSYTYLKLFQLAMDVVLSNSNKPLKMVTNLGLIISLISFAIAIYNIASYFMGFIKVPGFTTVIFSIWFIGGLILATLGVVGLYIGKIFNEVKHRQLYIISDMINLHVRE